MKPVLYVVPALVLSLAACSSGKGSVTAPARPATVTPTSAASTASPVAPTTSAQVPAATSPAAAPPSPSRAHAPTKPDVPDVKAQLLALSDLPAGWSKHKIDNSTAGEPACFKALDADTHKPVAKGQVEYQGSPRGLPLLDEDIAYDPKAAASEFTKVVKALDRCGKISISANGTTLSGAMGAMSFPKLGSQSKAYQLTLSGVVNGVRVTAGFDILVLRVGAEDVSLLYSTLGAPDIREFEGATRLVMNKLKGAGTTV